MDPDEQFALERLGTVLQGRWTLDRLLGVGGMAAVYAATDLSGARVAIKILHPELNRRADMRERFLREGQAANRVNHPGVVRISDALVTDGTAILVMELLEGESLTSLVKRKHGLSREELLDVMDQVLDVLAAAHEKGIIHRDLKPDNLFLTNANRVKVLDFGIARLQDSDPQHKTKTGLALGTVPYMAPEQALARRDEIDGRTDLFSLGALAFRIIAGRTVHVAESETEQLVAMATKPAPPLRSIATEAPEDLAAIIDVSLAFARTSRYPDASAMQADVRAVKQGKPPPHAFALKTVREAPTRVGIVVRPQSAEETVPTPLTRTQPDEHVSVTSAATDTLPDVAPTIPDFERPSRARTVRAVVTEPSSTSKTVQDEAPLAQTVENLAYSSPTVPMPVVPAPSAGALPTPSSAVPQQHRAASVKAAVGVAVASVIIAGGAMAWSARTDATSSEASEKAGTRKNERPSAAEPVDAHGQRRETSTAEPSAPAGSRGGPSVRDRPPSAVTGDARAAPVARRALESEAAPTPTQSAASTATGPGESLPEPPRPAPGSGPTSPPETTAPPTPPKPVTRGEAASSAEPGAAAKQTPRPESSVSKRHGKGKWHKRRKPRK